MSEKPMLFSSEMVRALLDGRKTQTRRIVKPQPKHTPILAKAGVTIGLTAEECKNDGEIWLDADCINPGVPMKCPHPIGSQIWVKETWQTDPAGKFGECYRATGHNEKCKLHSHLWRPSIFMPRWASRITLEVTEVRVQRLHDISEADAIAEGVTIRQDAKIASHFVDKKVGPAQFEYYALWESINGKGSWDKNPWVWVYTFKRVKP